MNWVHGDVLINFMVARFFFFNNPVDPWPSLEFGTGMVVFAKALIKLLEFKFIHAFLTPLFLHLPFHFPFSRELNRHPERAL